MDRKQQIVKMGQDMYNLLPDDDVNWRDCENAAEEMFDQGYREVVRCKDCKYHENLPDGKTWCCRCGGMARIRADGESFCSLAERREYETN